MDTILLRIMNYKSIITFGKYKGMFVQQLLDLKKHSYLRWIYFNYERLSFADDILKIIGVYHDKGISIVDTAYDFRIKKPGINKEYGEKVNEIMIKKLHSGLTKKHIKNILRKGFKKDIERSIYYNRIKYSKYAMQRRNQGH